MKRIALIAASVIIIFQCVMGQAPRGARNLPTPDDATVQELKQIDAQLDEAFLRGDKKVFERILSDEMISVSATGDVARKKDILSQILPTSSGVKFSIAAEDIQIYLFGDTAIVSSRKIVKEMPEKKAVSDPYRETNTYIRKAGRWRLIANQQAQIPPPYKAKEVQLNVKIDDTLMSGNKNATVVLIKFSDYQCPQCRRFAAGTMKQLEKDYIETGRVGFLIRHNPLEDIHPDAFKAAAAAHCAAAQGNFWEMNRRLFQEPMALTENDLLAAARITKLDLTKFRQCLSDETTTAALRQGMAEAKGLGVEGTPIFLIGTKKPGESNVKVLRMVQGAHTYEVFKEALDKVISVGL